MILIYGKFLICSYMYFKSKTFSHGYFCSVNIFFSSLFQTLGKVGRVQQIYHDNDLKVCQTLSFSF